MRSLSEPWGGEGDAATGSGACAFFTLGLVEKGWGKEMAGEGMGGARAGIYRRGGIEVLVKGRGAMGQ